MTKRDESVDDLKKKNKRLQVLSIGGWISTGMLAILFIIVIIISRRKNARLRRYIGKLKDDIFKSNESARHIRDQVSRIRQAYSRSNT